MQTILANLDITYYRVRIRDLFRTAAVLVLVACLAACQAAPHAPPAAVASGFDSAQIAALRELGFTQTLDTWEFDFADLILFGVDSYVVNQQASAQITRMGKTLKSVGIKNILVEGHADASGSKVHNDALSSRRAQAVADILLATGIDPGAITASGRGSSAPVEQNDTEAGRSQNRRAAIIVTAL